MYRMSISAMLISCLALVFLAGCKQVERAEDRAEVGEEAAAPSAGRYDVSDIEKEAMEREARDAYAQGILVRHAGDLKKAREHFARAVRLNPSYVEAHQALAEVNVALGEVGAEAAAGVELQASKIEAEMRLIRHEVRATIEKARELFQQEEFEEAVSNLEDALGLMKWATELYLLDFSEERPEAEVLLKSARIQHKVFLDAMKAEQRRQAKEKIAEELRKRAEYRRRQAEELLVLSRESLAMKNFAEALKFARRALLKDPANSEAMTLERIIVEERLNFERERIVLRTDMAWRGSFFRLEQAALPDARIMSWKDREEWMQKTSFRRERAKSEQEVFQRSAEQVQIEKKLDEATVRLLTIEPQKFPEAMKTIMRQFGNVVPIVLHPDVIAELEDEKIEIAIPKEITLKGAIEEALDQIPAGLGEYAYVIRDEAILITRKGAEETKRLIVYPVQDLLREIVPFSPPKVDIGRKDLFEVSGEYGAGDEEREYFGEGKRESRGEWDFQDPENFEPDSLKDLIINTIGGGPNDWNFDDANRGAPSTIDFRRGNMFISAAEGIHNDVQKLLSDIRATSEVLVTLEARFLDVQESLIEEIGVDLKGHPTEFQQFRAEELGFQFTDKFLEGFLTDVATELTEPGLFFAKRGAGIGFKDGERIFLPRGVPTGDALGLRSENILDGSLKDALGGGGGLTAGFSLRPGGSRINFVLNAMIESNRSTTLSAPKITTYNHQRAYIAVIKEQRFIGAVKEAEGTNPDDPASVDPISSLLPSGVVLSVTPNVTWDRKYVILEVRAYATGADLGLPVPLDLTPPAARASGDGEPVEQPKLIVEFNFPVINIQHIRTTVMIPDGGTVILGGLSQLQRADGTASTPLLGDIPIIKFFFMRKGTSADRSSLIVLIKADITVVPEQEKRFLEET